MQMNGIDIYAQAGKCAGKARKQSDESCARFHTDWMLAAIRLESPKYAIEARKAFDDAYRLEATPKVIYEEMR